MATAFPEFIIGPHRRLMELVHFRDHIIIVIIIVVIVIEIIISQ